MKPSHLSTPRQLSDCYFETGHSSVNPMPEIERRGHAFLEVLCAVGLAFFAGLWAGGVF